MALNPSTQLALKGLNFNLVPILLFDAHRLDGRHLHSWICGKISNAVSLCGMWPCSDEDDAWRSVSDYDIRRFVHNDLESPGSRRQELEAWQGDVVCWRNSHYKKRSGRQGFHFIMHPSESVRLSISPVPAPKLRTKIS